ncbi:MAG: hydrogenobyrinic acid a,c-diamide synthase (glutamine-hydrolyzing) [Chloroflexi bacterium]|nr:hydrogenobyrinic acid a,c-diamide synthase (glutamine-hydrolyzing) [Chloroflexota bacterium]
MPPRLVVAAPRGRSGKTLVSIGLCAALVERGLQVQPFKRGPDFIDPSWLSAAAGRPCRNLDVYLMGERQVAERFALGCEGVDLALIEGAMGLFDGLDDEGLGSTAHVAKILHAPAILVVDTSRMTRSVAALVQGYANFDPQLQLAGVILNNVAGARHEAKLRRALARHTTLPVLGAIPRQKQMTITQRHLGLVPRAETTAHAPILEAAHRAVRDHVDLDAVIALAHTAPPLAALPTASRAFTGAIRPTIGVACDEAFTFYYPSNLEALANAGANLVNIDLLHDRTLPPVDGLYLGGGFPEMFMAELEANTAMRAAIRAGAEAGLPVYAECGGLMYLAQSIRWETRVAKMAGVLPLHVEMTDRPQGHGYVRFTTLPGNPWFDAGQTIRGHEFHHSRVTPLATGRFAYQMNRGHGMDGHHDGLVQGRVLASYAHLHAVSVPSWAPRFVALANTFHAEQQQTGRAKYRTSAQIAPLTMPAKGGHSLPVLTEMAQR